MPEADVHGVGLHYEEAGTGRTVVFVHGIPTDYRAWGAQTTEFSKDRRTIALSRRYAYPNARTGDIADSTVQNNAADLHGFIGQVGGGPVDLVGHSYGGFISAFLAADHPEDVNRLVLVEPAVSTLLVADQASSAQLLGLLLRSPSVALSGRRFQSRSLTPSLRALEAGDKEKAVELNVDGVQDLKGAYRALPEEVRKMMNDNARTIAELKTVFPRFTAVEAAKIRAPTLVLNGENTALWLRRIGQLVAESVPGASREMVASARHFPHMENPAEFNGKVREFLGAAT
ncbi:MAG TPA: alpha/beta hydrolase [Nitrososphaerales archaeon]|nr:alpha/beta hydrolase [Nitrososphaerales archaeon]